MSKTYFSSLNYSLANEDTSLEYFLIKEFHSEKILSIAGSGARFIPLLSGTTRHLTYIDVCKEQLLLAELKLSTFRGFTYDEFLKFWTFAPCHEDVFCELRQNLFGRLVLTENCRSYFEEIFKENKWKSLLYEGKWEKTFQTLYKINKMILGKKMTEIFFCKTLEEQVEFYKKEFPIKRWELVIRFLGNKKIFDTLLYKGHFVNKNLPESYFAYYKKAFHHLFTKTLVRESFFLNLCFFGKIVFQEGNTLEGQEFVFNEVKKKLIEENVDLHPLNMDFNEATQKLKGENFDFISLSDVPSYFSGELEKNFLQNLRPTLKNGAIVVIRYYLRIAAVNEEGYEDLTSQFQTLIDRETVQMYRLKILKYRG